MLKTAFQSRSVEPFYTGGSVSLASDGQTLATTYDEDVVVTNLQTGEELHRIKGDGEDITSMQISPDGEYVVTGSRSLQMKIYQLVEESYRTVKAVKAHEAPILVMTIDPTSSLLATGGAEGAVKVWDLKGGYVTHNFRGHGGLISAVKFFGSVGSTNWQLASGSDEGKIRLWDLVKSKCLHVLDSHVNVVRGLDFSQDGKTLISGGRDKIVSVWDTKTGKLQNTIPVLESIECAGIFQGKIYTGGESGEVKLWQNGECVAESKHQLVDTKEEIMVTEIIKHEDTLFSVLSDQTIVQLDGELNVTKRVAGNHGEIIDCCYLNDKQLAIATNSPEVRVVSVDNMLDCEVLAGHTDIVIAIDRSVNGEWLITAGKDKIAKLWQLVGSQFAPIGTLSGHAGAIGAVGLPKGPNATPKFAITGSQDLTIKLWNVKTCTATYTRKAHDKDINAIDVSPDDRWFATASQDRTVKIWDVDTGESVGVLRGHRRGVWSVKFSHFDKVIATGSGDKTVKLWNLNDYTCIKTFEGHSNSVLKVGWLTNGLQLASAGGDGLVKVWDTKSGECNCTLDNHEAKVWSLAVRDDDTGFVTGGGDSVITVWTDVTEEVKAEEDEQRAKQVEQEQKLDNLVREGRWKEAVLLALELNHPYKLLQLMQKIEPEALQEVVSTIELESIGKLFERVRDWNTTAKTSQVAQQVLQTILQQRTVNELCEVKNIVKIVDALRPYSDRHFNRMDDLIEQSYSLDYVLREMEILL